MEEIGEARLLFEHHDYESIVSVTFSGLDRDHFYTLTNAGVVEKWSIAGEGKLLRL